MQCHNDFFTVLWVEASPRVIVSMDSVVYSAVSKEFNPQRPKAVSCTHFELAG